MEPLEICVVEHGDHFSIFHKITVDNAKNKVVLGYLFSRSDSDQCFGFSNVEISPIQARELADLLMRNADKATGKAD